MKNIVLIGMPSSGKSTVGKLLSDKMSMAFADTDALIFKRENRALRDIVNNDGLDAFLKIQQEVILKINLTDSIISTGGSVVYSEASMLHLKQNGVVVYLEEEYSEIEGRVEAGRRFARNGDQTLLDLYNERTPLYLRYADITIKCSHKSANEVAQEVKSIIEALNAGG
ncbi:shikimate kinase [Anaerobacterium chartisolvens]|uniref:Shikimate kinase n=1 Tax=Anaerobacterium chartisolvens TaxID=1297424 RepID=A0A369BAB3_9FIRM|nr:shikimate kinase [Anaerobacterium chartisolvens]RCX16624.1 shikimate kinase [Anaerobacterium chartisolvens]